MIGLTLVAFALWRPERPRPIESGRSTAMLAIPMLATATAVVVLVLSSIEQLPAVVVALATLTLAARRRADVRRASARSGASPTPTARRSPTS